jgi:hypothetical protein
MTTIYFDEPAVRQLNDNRTILFGWPRTGETLTYTFSLDDGDTYAAGASTIVEITPDGGDAEYRIPYNASERPTVAGNVIFVVTDGTDTGKITINVLTITSTIPPPSSQLTSLEEIQRTFSNVGVDEHTFDVTNNTETMNEIIIRASEEALTYLRGRYDINDMLVDYWVRMKATFIACHYLSIRLGNPGLYVDEYGEALMDLAQARDGIRSLAMPTLQRVIVQTPMQDSRFFHQNRIDQGRSSKIFPGQRIAYRLAVED